MAPNHWQEKKLVDFVKLQRGHDLPESERHLGTIPVVGSNGTSGYHNVAIAQGPGVIVGRSGASFGKVSFCETDYWPLNTALYAIDFHGNDEKFAYYFLSAMDFSIYNSGSAQPMLNRNYIHPLKVSIPPLSEQRAIANILGSLDDKIEVNRQMNATLEAMARALFKSWFVDFDPVRAKMAGRQPAGMDAATAALFPDGFEASMLGEIPRGWRVGSLGGHFTGYSDCVITGPFGSTLHASDYMDTGIPLILVKHVNNGHIANSNLPLISEHKAAELKRYRVKAGDIVFTRVGAVGRSAYVQPASSGWLISGQMLRVRIPTTSEINPRYLSQVFLEPRFIEMVEGHALGTTRPSLNTSILKSFKFLIPPFPIQERFFAIASHIDMRVQFNLQESEMLSEIRNGLLQRLLSGELSISADDDEVTA